VARGQSYLTPAISRQVIDDYLSRVSRPSPAVLLTPRDARSRPGVEVALAELRRTAVAAYGAPLATDAGAVVLPRTQQTVTMPADQVAWKVVGGPPPHVAGTVPPPTPPSQKTSSAQANSQIAPARL